MTGEGVDTSRYNHGPAQDQPIDWTAVAATGVGFVIAQLVYGDRFVTPWGTDDVAGARAAGLTAHGYQWVLWGRPVPAQVAYLLANCPQAVQVLWADAEDETGRPSWPEVAAALAEWAHEVEQAGKTAGFYLNLSWYDALAAYGFPWSHPVWLADPSSPTPRRPAVVHQYGTGTVTGIPGDTDLDRIADPARWATLNATGDTDMSAADVAAIRQDIANVQTQLQALVVGVMPAVAQLEAQVTALLPAIQATDHDAHDALVTALTDLAESRDHWKAATPTTPTPEGTKP